MKSSRFLSMAIIGLAGAAAQAQYVYGVAVGGDLYHINVATGASSLVGNTGVSLMESISYSPNGLVGADGSGNFYSINESNASVTLLGNTGLGNVEGMDVAGGTTLWGSDFNGPTSLHELNPATGVPTGWVVTADTNNGVARSLTFNSGASIAYTAQDGPTFQSLQAMDASGTTTIVGTLPYFTAAIQNVGGDRYIALGTNGEVYSLDVTTAGMQQMHDLGDQFFLGVAASPVPEPGTMAALGLGLAAIARRRRKA